MIEHAFEQYARDAERAPELIAKLVNHLRPEKPHQTEDAITAIQALCESLNQAPEKAQLLREAVLSLLSERKPISLFLIARHSVFSSFFSEMRRRIAHKFLPEAIDPSYLMDLFAQFFTKSSDEVWINAVPDTVWVELIVALQFAAAPIKTINICREHLLDAAQVLSYRVTALGLEPELLRNHPELEKHTSPFITQNEEFAAFFIAANAEDNTIDTKHILVMLDQCKAIVGKIRRNSSQEGTSITLTYLLQRMTQQIQRLEVLLHILTQHIDADLNTNAHLEMVHLFKELVYSECHKNDVGEHWQENLEVMALRVTENASRTGEHYITNNQREYFALMRSAMGAGLVIAIMSMIKILLADLHLAPLTEAILFSLNYGLGFMLIHILHFTVATKQPAMTAAAIASSIDAADGKSKEMSSLIAIISNTVRSQIVAILGNVTFAIPMAMLIGWCFLTISGQHFITPEKAQHLLTDIDPIRSGALFYAAIAGVCLFLSGLIAGYYDNLAIYNKIPQRIRAVKCLQKLLGLARLDRVAHYIENNLGALAGNFYFGCLLGGMSAIGVLFGLSFDIRHIAFSSAFVGFAAFDLDFILTWQTAAYAALGLGLIAFMNLTVSFSLALYVAMKSRKIRFKQWKVLLIQLGSRLNQHPAEFILPPKKSAETNDTAQSHT